MITTVNIYKKHPKPSTVEGFKKMQGFCFYVVLKFGIKRDNIFNDHFMWGLEEMEQIEKKSKKAFDKYLKDFIKDRDPSIGCDEQHPYKDNPYEKEFMSIIMFFDYVKGIFNNMPNDIERESAEFHFPF